MTCQKNDYDFQPQWLAMLASDVHRDHTWTVEISSVSYILKRTLKPTFLLTLLVYGLHQCLVEDPHVNIEIAHFVEVSKWGFVGMYEGFVRFLVLSFVSLV